MPAFYYRQECSKLRQELRLQHEEDKKSAMSQLLQLKEREKNAARDSWQKKVEDLLTQVDPVCTVGVRLLGTLQLDKHSLLHVSSLNSVFCQANLNILNV